MDAETFAEWMRRQGHIVYRTESSYWYDAGPRVYQAFPFHWLIKPSAAEIRKLTLFNGIAAVRYSSPIDFPKGKVSYHVILDRPYELEKLKPQARNGIKRGLENFKIEKIPLERMAADGWVLQQDTLARQDRLRSMTQKEWECLCISAADLPGIEAWAATSNGELAGAVIICQIDDVVCVPYAMSHSRFLAEHVNNAVFYAVSREILGRDNIKSIFFTVQSLDAPPNVDEFKFRMGLKPIAVRQCVDFHPMLEPFAAVPTHSLFQKLLQRDQSNPFLAKAEGMLRFHLEGQRDIANQSWADCLADQKEALLHNN